MSSLDEQIDISAPAEAAWEQLHRIDAYPQFVGGVLQAASSDAGRAHLDVKVSGAERGLDARITDRAAEREMSWQTLDRPELKGRFTVREIDAGHSRLQVDLEYDPDEVRASFGGPKVGIAQASAIERMVRADLQQFKQLCEGGA